MRLWPWLVPLFAFAAAVAAQIGLGAYPVDRPNDPLYLPDAQVARHLDLGFGEAWADLLHIQALIYVVEEFDDRQAGIEAATTELERQAAIRETKYIWLAQLYNSITALDPKFREAYLYGARFLTLLGQDDQAAIALLERGILELPDAWDLKEELGMLYYIDRKDPEAALKWLQEAIKHPDCSPLLIGFVTRLSEGTDYDFEVLRSLERQIQSYDARGDHRMVQALQDKRREHFARIALRRLTDMYAQAIAAGAAKERLTLDALQDACLKDRILPPGFFEAAGGFWYEPSTGRIESIALAPAERERRRKRTNVMIAAFHLQHDGRWPADRAEFEAWSPAPLPPHPLSGWSYQWDPSTGAVTEKAP